MLLLEVGNFYKTLSISRLILQLLLLVLTGLVIWVAVDYGRILRLRARLPPGPFPLPLLGNYLHMRMKRPWEHWEELANDLNAPLMTLWNGHRPVLVCSDAWTVADLFEKRAAIYSSRPQMIMMGDMSGATENNQVCLKYDDKWRYHRRLTHSVVGAQAVRNYRGFQSDETKILLEDLLTRPEEYVASIERYSCSIVTIVGWGRRISGLHDPVADRAIAFMDIVNAVIPGQAMMEVIPALAKLPWWINPLPSIIGNATQKMTRYWFALAEEGAKYGSENNFSKRLLKEHEENGLSWKEISNLTSNLIGGGVDTTSGSMISLILAMCVFRDKQRKAQEELDRVVGRDRMPDWEDEESLSYVTATVQEVLRWRTITILGGIPHAPTQDDTYKSFHIPKDTWIVGNLWAIHRNPNDYPEPDDFIPERFLPGAPEQRPHPSKKGHNAFGWGRRQCSGQPLAEQGLWLVTARLLWAFDVRAGVDVEGNELLLDIFAYTASENQRPLPFKARFIPRFDGIARMIEKEAEMARSALAMYDGETKVSF